MTWLVPSTATISPKPSLSRSATATLPWPVDRSDGKVLAQTI